MTRIVEDETAREDGATAGGRRRADRRAQPVRWLPGLLLLGWTIACLRVSGVPALDTTIFVGYVVVCLSLPGTLLWRLLVARGTRPWLEDVVLGTLLAFAVEVPTYLLARAAGAPRLALLWVVLVVATALVHPRRRELWRPTGTTAAPAWWGWTVALALAFLVGWCFRNSWLPTPVEGSGLRFLYTDLPFHLALITDLRHHSPGDFPYVAGQTLQYHWFGHAQMAASSWATGVEPFVLLARLSPLLALVLGVVGAATLARRAGGGWGGAAVTAVLLAAVGNLNSNMNLFLNQNSYLSPTQTFGAACLVLVLVVATIILRSERPGPGPWIVFVAACLLLSGAKATFVPVALGGCAVVVVVRLLVARRVDWRSLAMGVVLAGSLLAASVLVYGGSAPGLQLAPFQSAVDNIRSMGFGERAGTTWALIAMIGYLVPKVAPMFGAAGLRRGLLDDPVAILLLGCVLAAGGAMYTFAHPDLSQYYFIMSGAVPAGVLSGWGLGVLWREVGVPVRWAALGLVAVGTLVGHLLSAETTRRQLAGEPGELSSLRPALVIAAVTALVVVMVLVTPVRRAGFAAAACVVSLAVATTAIGLGLGQATEMTARAVADPVATRWQAPPQGAGANLAPGGLRTAEWLRENTDPDDVLATDGHCRVAASRGPQCDRRAFSLAAFAERRFVVEGWAYTPPNAALASRLGQPACCIAFWDPARLAVNDAAFDDPSAADLERLRSEHGVDWLVVNTLQRNDWEPLRRLADERFAAGPYVVLELRDPRSSREG